MKTKLLIVSAFVCIMGFSSCENDEAGPIGLPTEFYFEADINGKSLALSEGKDGYESIALASELSGTSGCIEAQTMKLSKGQNQIKSFEVSIIQRLDNCTSECSKAEEMFQTNNYPFGKLPTASDASYTDGVVIRYIDIDGKVWSTDFGTADQTGSSFNVIALVDNKMDEKSRKIASAEFNCKLYDTQGGEIVVQNGKLVSRGVKCN